MSRRPSSGYPVPGPAWLIAISLAILLAIRLLDLRSGLEIASRAPQLLPAEQDSSEPPTPEQPEGPADERVSDPATDERASLPGDAHERAGEDRPARLEAIDELCRRISSKLASVDFDDCFDAGFWASGGWSLEGSPILVRDSLSGSTAADRVRVLVVGGIHGDELSSVSIVFRWNRLLSESHSLGPHFRLVPVLNPDGLLLEVSRRQNANGVDLNRNFPSPDWRTATQDYWIRRTSRNPRRYPGESALSEPESRWLADEIGRFHPHVVVSVHAPHGVLDFDGPPKAPLRLGPLILDPIGTYPGSLGRWAGVLGGLRVVTIELPSAGIMPTVREQEKIWDDLKLWIQERIPVPQMARSPDAA